MNIAEIVAIFFIAAAYLCKMPIVIEPFLDRLDRWEEKRKKIQIEKEKKEKPS